MLVSELIAQLQTLPADKSIICQVVGKTSNPAWNMEFAFSDVTQSTFVQLRVTHPDLLALPDINFGGGQQYPFAPEPTPLFREFKGSLNLTNEQKQHLRLFVATDDTSFSMGEYGFLRICRGGATAIEFFSINEPLVSYLLDHSQYAE